MADISTWSPVDESNTAAPPDGWPEFMQNNMVNNCARAMMGAIRRFYDQVIAGTLELPYLKLSGGSVTGSLSAVDYKLSGVTFAARDASVNYHYVLDADGFDPALLLGGAASGYNNIYRAEHHLFQSNNGAVTYATINAAGVSTPGTVTAAQLTASSNITATGTVTGNAVNSNGNAGVAGTMTATAVVGGTVHANTTLSAGTSVAAPTIAASSTVSGGNVAASNSVTAGTFVDAPQYRLAGVPVVFATTTALEALEARIAALEAA